MATNTHVGHDSPDVVGDRDRLGVMLLIVADIAFVFSLSFSYLYLRGLNTNDAWLTKETTVATQSSIWGITLLVLFAALSFNWGLRGIKAGNNSRLLLGSLSAFLSSLIALAWQFWQFNSAPYFVPATSGYTSMLIALAVGNMIHLILTSFISFGIWNRARLNLFSKNNHWNVKVVGIWFAWVALSTVLTSLLTLLVQSPGK